MLEFICLHLLVKPWIIWNVERNVTHYTSYLKSTFDFGTGMLVT